MSLSCWCLRWREEGDVGVISKVTIRGLAQRSAEVQLSFPLQWSTNKSGISLASELRSMRAVFL